MKMTSAIIIKGVTQKGIDLLVTLQEPARAEEFAEFVAQAHRECSQNQAIAAQNLKYFLRDVTDYGIGAGLTPDFVVWAGGDNVCRSNYTIHTYIGGEGIEIKQKLYNWLRQQIQP